MKKRGKSPFRIICRAAVTACLFSAIRLSAQDTTPLKNETGLTFFAFERNGETLNHGLEPKFITGPYYARNFGKTSWISSFEFGKNHITDANEMIYDSYYGKGVLTEYSVSSAVRYSFIRSEKRIIYPFIESGLFYTWSHYEGDFEGGFSGDGTERDNTYNTVGITGRTGLTCLPVKRVSITLALSARFGFVSSYYPLADTHDSYTGITSITLLQIRAGYRF